MTTTRMCIGAVFGVLLGGTAFAMRAQEPFAASTRKIFEQYKDAVVWVSAVARVNFTTDDAKGLSFSMPEREQKFEALGTVIEPSGLIVTALSMLDPSKQISGRRVSTPSGEITIDAAVMLKEVKIIMADGAEIPADVVMKDADLDLAFIRPKPDARQLKEVKFKAVDLNNNTAADIPDEVVTVSRMDEVFGRQPAVQRGQIVGITRKPRTFLRATGMYYGCPTFAMDGRLIGISVNRFNRQNEPQPVILPAADVLEIAAQAKAPKQAPTAEPKAAESQKPTVEDSAPHK